MHFSYAFIAETDSGRHTVIYNCLYHLTKKDTKAAVMKRMDRTFNNESLYHLYSSSFTTLHTKINYMQ